MERKERIKWISTILFALIAVMIIIIAVGTSWRNHHTSPQKELVLDDPYDLTGTIKNAYVAECTANTVVIWYEGKEYTLQGALESAYTGVADLELKNGQILSVNAKPEYIQGTLDSYTDESVQVSGYEMLFYENELPVYVLQPDAKANTAALAGQKKLSDLVVGTSKVRLAVAEGKACAIIQYQQDSYERVRVLIKNGTALTYDRLFVTSDKAYQVDGKEKKKVTNVKKLLKDCKIGEEIRIEPKKGMLYLSNADGDYIGDGYEGDFLVRKAEDGYVLVNEVEIETYLRYVLPSEMPTYFSYEALKAQAVCARTFAYKQMQSNAYAQYGANLDDSTAFQVYHAAGTYEITNQAVDDTNGIVLTYQGELIDCYYYSTSPGYSENLEVWNADSPAYLTAENHTGEKEQNLSKAKTYHQFISEPVEAYDKDSPYYRWSAELSAKLGMDAEFGRLKKLTVNERSESGYILSLTVTFEDGERTYDRENDIRFALGKYLKSVTLADGTVRTDYSSVPSACFEVTEQKDGCIQLHGGGFGHGIGLSQYGANGMGEQGYSWQDILAFYYKGTTVQSLQ